MLANAWSKQSPRQVWDLSDLMLVLWNPQFHMHHASEYYLWREGCDIYNMFCSCILILCNSTHFDHDCNIVINFLYYREYSVVHKLACYSEFAAGWRSKVLQSVMPWRSLSILCTSSENPGRSLWSCSQQIFIIVYLYVVEDQTYGITSRSISSISIVAYIKSHS